jgi:2-polyprenyl-3-methyl-5-hydroxy-6-metoxy-1,4-benzoquinol methylase/tetratricopeptide (TPR) repeat protein
VNRKQRRAEGKGGKTGGKGAANAPNVAPSGRIEDQIFQAALFDHQSGRVREAESGYRDVLARNPRHAGALGFLGLLAHQSGHSDDGIELLKKAIATEKRNPDLRYNLACMFADVGRDDEAIQENRKAIELKPDYIAAHGNLSALLLLSGQADEALAATIRGLKIEETKSLTSTFAMLAPSLDPAKVQLSDDLLRTLTRALTEPWARPRDLAGFALAVLTRDPVIAGAIERISRPTPQRASGIFYSDELTAIDRNELLHAVLRTSPVTTAAVERLLTALRRAVLEEVSVSSAVMDQWLPLMSSVAQQCFINDHIFDGTQHEGDQVAALYDDVVAAVTKGDAVAPIKIALLASYLPLHSIEGAEKLLSREWPEPLRAVIAQQISNPNEELAIRSTIENLTPVTDLVSEKVRAQYEESPYPKWTRVVSGNQPVTIDQYIGMRFPGAPYRSLGKGPLNLLVAGCGTGMHAIQRAQQFTQANVLAIDLSLSSLSYAIRKTREIGLTNIRYAQADILEFKSDKAFDVIDSSGVLHHLNNPLDGWRRLAGMVRPGGLMHIGLYSAMARQAINVARESFAEQGRQFSPAEARRLRTEILNRPADDPMRKVAQFSDFFSMSEFRDLLFHVQEHQFSLPQIADIIKDLGFTFLGFETQARVAYLKRFPDDAGAVDLDNWNIFETENPATFTQMYQFWIQKK